MKSQSFTKEDIVQAVMSPAKCGEFQPVQMQKLLFLVDKNISKFLGGPFFDFKPYHYGPFDKEVYRALELLQIWGQVEINNDLARRRYRLTPEGLKEGEKTLSQLPSKVRTYIEETCSLVRRLSFAELVVAIYKAYPEMKEKSVFPCWDDYSSRNTLSRRDCDRSG